MSTSSSVILRNGKSLIPTTSNTSTKFPNTEKVLRMENNSGNLEEQVQTGRNSLTNGSDSQRANDERFDHLQNEMITLKAMKEKLLEQNEERNRQLDTATATSSFAVRSSNNDNMRFCTMYHYTGITHLRF